MRKAIVASMMVVRVTGIALVILGVLFWTGHARSLVPLHMLLGLLFTLGLLALALLGTRAGASPLAVAGTLALVVLIPALGMTQTRLLPGSAHWVIQVVHLLFGAAGMGVAQALVRPLRSAPRAVAAPRPLSPADLARSPRG